MSSSAASDLDNLPPAEMEIIDEACDRFERAWRNGQSPSLDEYVNQAPERLRKLLLQELLAIELPYRRQLGQSITSEDYTSKFADLDVRRFRQINAKATEAAQQAALNGLLSPFSDPHSGNCILGDFRLIKEVGRGGMGIVYAAEQISLGRQVALKVLPSSQRLSARHLQRFQNEARAAASLQHPNIVPVFAVGAEQELSHSNSLAALEELASKVVIWNTVQLK